MTTRTILQLTVATMLAGSGMAAVELSSASMPVVSAPIGKSEVTPFSGPLLVHLHRVADRFTADCAGLKMAPPPIVCLTL
jgi:hypothetical protein